MKKSILLSLFISFCSLAFANNMLVQNVSTTGNNAVNKTIQVQFDISWDNSWRDAINWDAAWIFMKFKDANGLWQHCKLNQTGFTNGSGTANTVQVTSDKVGSWLYRSALGSGTFNSTGIQLQWNYGLAGLTNVTGLEVRVFAVEMVYVPEGEFNCAKLFYGGVDSGIFGEGTFTAPGNNFPVINDRLSPPFNININILGQINFRVNGNVGIDINNDGTIENTTFPTGYKEFFCYKYELTEQQYADFLNTLTSAQTNTLGVAGSSISYNNGQYFSSNPNKACGNSDSPRFLAYADWSGLRPMSILEFNKISYGPITPIFAEGGPCNYTKILYGYPAFGSISGSYNFEEYELINAGFYANAASNRAQSGASYYAIYELTGNAHEPVVKTNFNFNSNFNGDGVLSNVGSHNVNNWNNLEIMFIDMLRNINAFCISTYWNNALNQTKYGFRYVRSAE